MKRALFLCILLSACGTGSGSGSKSTTTTSVIHAVANASDGTIQLSWAPGTGTTTGYYLEQSTDGTNFQQIRSGPATSATITGATYGQPYYFRVRAYNSAGTSPYSSVATVTP